MESKLRDELTRACSRRRRCRACYVRARARPPTYVRLYFSILLVAGKTREMIYPDFFGRSFSCFNVDYDGTSTLIRINLYIMADIDLENIEF